MRDFEAIGHILNSPAIVMVLGTTLGSILTGLATRRTMAEHRREADKERSFRRDEAVRSEQSRRAERRLDQLFEAYTKVLGSFDRAIAGLRAATMAGTPLSAPVAEAIEVTREWSLWIGLLDTDVDSQKLAADLYARLADPRWGDAASVSSEADRDQRVRDLRAECREIKQRLLLRLQKRFSVEGISQAG